MLHHIKFKKDYRCFQQGDVFYFRPGINLLVGDQGSGKSTLIQLLRSSAEDSATVAELVSIKADPIPMLSKDFEKENPRMIQYFGQSGASEMFEVQSRFMSHGQTSMIFINALKQVKGPTFLLVDEPDTALSPRSVLVLAGLFRHVVDKGGQVVAAVHNPLLIESVPEVFSLEHRIWIASLEFMISQREAR